ncbi:MAG: AAA family ATPase [Acidobacteriota bacterium]|nr:AAA family ATPase [Acidobacteriota bacterium]
MKLNSPTDLYARLAEGVIDQRTALEQISVSLFKHIRRIRVGNILLIGNSGTGKTTIMRTIEKVFSEDPDLSRYTNTIRLNANIVADDDSLDLEGSVILERLRQNALRILAGKGDAQRFRDLMENGVVFLDEVDKIRAVIGDKANTRGILAQEALLTLIEGERVRMSFTRKKGEGGLEQSFVHIDTSRILFICGGAFEGLYDMVYHRVASGEHKDKLSREYVVGDNQDSLEEKEHFTLGDYVRYEDIFAYGMTPQFLGRFDEVIVLNDLTATGLMRIFVEPKDSMFREAKRYFRSLGVDLQITRDALKALAEAAQENHRLGARALRMVFKRILRGIEFDPHGSYMLQEQEGQKALVITRDMVRNLS